ncbi:MAG: T9SS type A sorting domain-containing protein [Bacteroidales bacterium]|nr:T9SS type A sorting domain-containing protein [Bacteroidales bacterium]
MSAAATYSLNVSLTYVGDENTDNNNQSYEVKVFGNPVINFGVTNDTIRTHIPYTIDAGEGFVSYKWQNNSTDRYLNINEEGYYSVLVTDNNNCSVKDSVYILNTTGVGSLSDIAEISIYPNPVSEYLHITINLEKRQNLTIDVISQEGKSVFRKQLTNSDEYWEDVDVSVLPKGLYYVRIFTKDSMFAKKIVVK